MAAAVVALLALGAGAWGLLSLAAPLQDEYDADQRNNDGLDVAQRERARQVAQANGLYWAPGDPIELGAPSRSAFDTWVPAGLSAYGRRAFDHRSNRLFGYTNLNDPYRLPPAVGTPRDVGTLLPGMAASEQTKRAVDERVAYAMAQELQAKSLLNPNYVSSRLEPAPPPYMLLGARVFS